MSDQDNKPKQGQINIELDEKVAEGTYSNLGYYQSFCFRICGRLCKYHAWNS